ncbi:MAG TPA: hypothetical protein VGK67_10105 [Myxococcales bacterium]
MPENATTAPAPAATEARPVVSNEVIRRIVGRLSKVQRDSRFAEIFDTFNVILEELFDGDVNVYRSRGERDPSIRKVAEQEDLPIAGSTLYLYMRLGELSERLGGVAQYPNLDPTHLREVLGLPTEQQKALLRQANDERWPAYRLRQTTSVQRIKTERDEVRYVGRELDSDLRELARLGADADGLLADLKRAKASPERVVRVGKLLEDLRQEVQAVHDEAEAQQKSKKA